MINFKQTNLEVFVCFPSNWNIPDTQSERVIVVKWDASFSWRLDLSVKCRVFWCVQNFAENDININLEKISNIFR